MVIVFAAGALLGGAGACGGFIFWGIFNPQERLWAFFTAGICGIIAVAGIVGIMLAKAG